MNQLSTDRYRYQLTHRVPAQLSDVDNDKVCPLRAVRDSDFRYISKPPLMIDLEILSSNLAGESMKTVN